MQVKMITATFWNERRLRPGDAIDVDEKTAARWKARGLAVVSETEKPPAAKPVKSLKDMNTAELTAKAAELGVDISAAQTNKERVEAIQTLLAQQEPAATPPQTGEPAAEGQKKEE